MTKKTQTNIPIVQPLGVPIADLLITQQTHKNLASRSVTASAPGKLMLLGEHAVIYGQPCLVTAVDQRIQVSISSSSKLEIVAKEVTNTRFVSVAIDLFLERYAKDNHFRLTTGGNFFNYGLGSSSAVTVATLAALSAFFEVVLSQRELFDLAYKVVLEVQQNGSGFDVAAAVYGGTFYFVTGGKVIEPLNVDRLPLVVGYSGVKADTVTLMKQVAKKFAVYTQKKDRIMEAIGKIVEDGKKALVEADWERLGKLMDFNQEYLRDLGVSTEKLEALIGAAKKAGAYGAKLSGAGGGDCMIAIVSEDKRTAVCQALMGVGGEVVDGHCSVEGVQVEG